MSVEVIVALVTGGITVIGGIITLIVTKLLNKNKESFDQTNQLYEGIRKDLERKEEELRYLKGELKVAELLADDYRKMYWNLYEDFAQLKVITQTLLLRSGLTREQIQSIIPFNFDTHLLGDCDD